MSNEAFARVKIDALLAAQGRDVLDTTAMRFEVQLPDGTRADWRSARAGISAGKPVVAATGLVQRGC